MKTMRYKVFGRRTGLRVSEIALGAGMFGTRWGHGAEPAEARRIFDGYVEAGVIGPRTRAQLDDNLGALNVPLSAAHLRRLDEESAVPLGFPHEMLTRFEGLGQQIAGGKADLLDAPAVAVP